jgi:hypothetical protein
MTTPRLRPNKRTSLRNHKTKCSKTWLQIFILSPCMLLLFLFITNSCTQLQHFHNFHLKLYTLKMFVMRTKTNLKPYMFRSVRRPSSGVGSRALYNYYLSIFLLLRIPVTWWYVFCNIQHPYYSFRNVVIWDIDYYTRGCVA